MAYDKSFVNKMGWQEFGLLFENLLKKLLIVQGAQKIEFDAVVPILRTGAIPGMMLANRLKILNVIPIQYKYDYTINKPILLMLSKLPPLIKNKRRSNILIVEGSYYSGKTAQQVSKEIHKLLPYSKLHFACFTKVYDDQNTDDGFASNTYAVLTNEASKLSSKAAKKMGVREGVTIFPWEEIEVELADSQDG